MENKQIGCPRTAYELFLKLYCKKRGSPSEKNNITFMAAIKAWTTLKEEEKKTFIEKFIQCKEKHKNQLAKCLEKMKPYMKEKQIKRLPEVDKSQSLVANDVVDTPEERQPHIDGQNENTANTKKSNCTMSEISSIQDQQSDSKIENLEECKVQEYEIPVLSEPSPPSVRNSIDLFNLIKNKNGDRNMEWALLSKVEKIRYRKAVSELKKDYIQNYKRYLESLPLKELFKFYHNKKETS